MKLFSEMHNNKIFGIAAALGAALVTGLGVYYIKHRKDKKRKIKLKVEKVLGILNQEHCHFKDVAILRKKIEDMVIGGGKSIQIVTDFDRTLTKAFVDGQSAHVSYGVIDDSSFIPDWAVQELNSMKSHYFPIEMSTSMSEAEKLPLMIEWYNNAFQIAIKAHIKRNMLPSMVRESNVQLRDGADQFFHLVTENKIPIYILSAGVGDIIEEILKQQAEIPPQLKLVANYYSYDSDGTMVGRDGDLIHTFNKHETSYKSRPYFHSIRRCKNVIVMGDTLGDPVMADGVEYLNQIIKIGFLNKNMEDSMSAYLAVYDIVLTNDHDMDIITLMLHEMIKV